MKTLLRRAAIALTGASLVLLGLVATPAYANANPQDHCNGVVCVGAQSWGGSGPDIINAEVETRNQFPLPLHTVIYLNYGSSPTNAKQRVPYAWCISETSRLYGCVFGIGKTLNVGWVLCGQIIHYVGYPCITIGR